ncbi:MAG TPA: hypothetical protein VLH75_01430, partial [Longimicrobiales bacterium]|nr:hypothetical protein [Longimicrobiales bacterium]
GGGGGGQGRMQARFRIRTAEGQAIEPRTLEIFSEMVRSGVIRPQDLVFDALTAQWVEAREHPMVRLFQDPLLEEPPGGGLDLALADPSGPSPEEREAAFIQRMEEERRSDPERVPLAMEVALVGVADRAWAPPELGRGGAGPAVVVPAPPRRHPARSSSWWRGLALAGAAGAALAVFAAVVSLRAPDSPAATLSGGSTAPAALAARAEGAVRDEARADFLRRVAGRLDMAGLAEVPAVWLEGRYLAHADANPEVRSYWEGVRAFVDGVQRDEEGLYREAWLAKAEGLGLSGPVRSLRLATALEDFAAQAPLREEHYRRVRELAASALSLHDLLVALGDRVTYEPIRGGGISADPVLEAAGTDPAAQLLLEEALDRVLAALRPPGGDSLRDRARLAAWMGQVPF